MSSPLMFLQLGAPQAPDFTIPYDLRAQQALNASGEIASAFDDVRRQFSSAGLREELAKIEEVWGEIGSNDPISIRRDAHFQALLDIVRDGVRTLGEQRFQSSRFRLPKAKLEILLKLLESLSTVDLTRTIAAGEFGPIVVHAPEPVLTRLEAQFGEEVNAAIEAHNDAVSRAEEVYRAAVRTARKTLDEQLLSTLAPAINKIVPEQAQQFGWKSRRADDGLVFHTRQDGEKVQTHVVKTEPVTATV